MGYLPPNLSESIRFHSREHKKTRNQNISVKICFNFNRNLETTTSGITNCFFLIFYAKCFLRRFPYI